MIRPLPLLVAGLLIVPLGMLALPVRFVVDGVSMAPGLLPGDVVASGWFPALDRLRRVRRWERWITTAPDGTPAIKRVVGLPGETIAIRDGDLTVAGRILLTPPPVLAEVASTVPDAPVVSAGDDPADAPWQRAVSLPVVLDDAAFAPAERRLLLPVHDVGMAAVLRLPEPPGVGGAVRMQARVGDHVVRWRLGAAGRVALVAGRLDGHLVAAAWPIGAEDSWPAGNRFVLPPRPPQAWDVARPWPDATPDQDGRSTTLGLSITIAGIPLAGPRADGIIERLAVWRDTLQRPAADGVVEWRLAPDAFFVLGDFPSGSLDSRHWGPLARSRFVNRAGR